MSKSGLYAHFGSKEELQLATIDTAEEIYERDVYDKLADVEPGIDGAIALADTHLDHLRRRVFPGRLLLRCGGRRPGARAGHRPRPRGHVPVGLGPPPPREPRGRGRERRAAGRHGRRPADLRPHGLPRARPFAARVRRQRQRPRRRPREPSGSASAGPDRTARGARPAAVRVRYCSRPCKTTIFHARAIRATLRTPQPPSREAHVRRRPGRIAPAARDRRPRPPPRLRREARARGRARRRRPRGRAGRVLRAARAERRRQDDADQDPHDAAPADERRGADLRLRRRDRHAAGSAGS